MMSALGHFMKDEESLGALIGIDDGEGVVALYNLIGCAFVTLLDALDRAGQLKEDSEFRDLGLVMSIYLDWSEGMPGYGIDTEIMVDDEDGLDWRELIVVYSKKAGIDLSARGCHSVTKCLEDVDMAELGALKGKAKAGRWKWNKRVSIAFVIDLRRLR